MTGVTMKNYSKLPTQDDFVVVLLTPALLKALDRYIEEETDGVTRPAALRSAFEDWCTVMGYITPNEVDPRLN
jgi:hypothetical protein